MAYTSDLRIKNYIRDVDHAVRVTLDNQNLSDKLHLRIFDESSEDQNPWENGGLAFNDPDTGMLLGSNDAGWFINNEIPLVIVEGTYATERGQFGDGQLNRFSHSLGVALNGYIGVTLVPYIGQSFVKSGIKRDIKATNINYQNGLLHKGMVYGALNASNSLKGKYLIIDPYDENLLVELVVNTVFKYFRKSNQEDKIIQDVLSQMHKYLDAYIFGGRSTQIIQNLFDEKGEVISRRARFYTQNLAALTTSTKRDAHGLLGKNLINIFATKESCYSIYIRLTESDIQVLRNRNSKEFHFLLNHPRIVLKCFDDLLFLNRGLEMEVIKVKDVNLHQTTHKPLMKRVQAAFNSGEIRIKL